MSWRKQSPHRTATPSVSPSPGTLPNTRSLFRQEAAACCTCFCKCDQLRSLLNIKTRNCGQMLIQHSCFLYSVVIISFICYQTRRTVRNVIMFVQGCRVIENKHKQLIKDQLVANQISVCLQLYLQFELLSLRERESKVERRCSLYQPASLDGSDLCSVGTLC